jgi:hypothetical protein
MEVNVVSLFCEATIGASGAVSASYGKGVTSITKETAAGQYTILLDDQYSRFLGGTVTLLDTADSDPATVGVHARIKAQTVTASTKTVVVQFYAGDDGAVANPASGAKFYVRLDLRNSSVE